MPRRENGERPRSAAGARLPKRWPEASAVRQRRSMGAGGLVTIKMRTKLALLSRRSGQESGLHLGSIQVVRH